MWPWTWKDAHLCAYVILYVVRTHFSGIMLLLKGAYFSQFSAGRLGAGLTRGPYLTRVRKVDVVYLRGRLRKKYRLYTQGRGRTYGHIIYCIMATDKIKVTTSGL